MRSPHVRVNLAPWTRPRDTRRARRRWLSVEVLEAKRLLSGETFTWTGAGHDGLWDDGENWKNDSGDPAAIPVPSAGADVVIGPNSGTIRLGLDSASDLICGTGTTLVVDGGSLIVEDGMTLDGIAEVDDGGELYFAGDQTLSGSGKVVFGPAIANQAGTKISNTIKIGSLDSVSHNNAGSTAPATLVIGPQITITGDSGQIGGDYLSNQGTITSSGTIDIGYNDNDVGKGFPGGYFLTGFDNPGTVQATGSGTVAVAATNQTLGGTLEADGGTILLEHSALTGPSTSFVATRGGTIDFATVIDNEGKTISLDDAGGSVTASTYSIITNGSSRQALGTILGGTIVARSAGSGIGGRAVLVGVTLSGQFLEKSPELSIEDGLTLNGTLTIDNGDVAFQDTQEIDGIGQINLGSSSDNAATNEIDVQSHQDVHGQYVDSALTLGSGITLTGPRGQVMGGAGDAYASHYTLINNGRIPNVEQVEIDTDHFVNQGYVACAGNGNINVGGVINTGYLGVTRGGTLKVGELTNYGTISLDSGRLEASSVQQLASGTLDIALRGTAAGGGYGQLKIDGFGPQHIGGALNITLDQGFTPANGGRFAIVTYKPSASAFKAATKGRHPFALFDSERGLSLSSGGNLKNLLTKNTLFLVASVSSPGHKPHGKASGHTHG